VNPTPADLDVVGIGNALVDVISHEGDDFVAEHDLVKGSMTLIDEHRATQLYAAMGPGIEMSGGSAANTMTGIASFGGKAAYIGKVRDDQLGEVYVHDIRATGVEFHNAAARSGPATGRCLIVVTPDAQRTMNTYLGASEHLCPDDVDPGLVARAQVLYLEGYLFDRPEAQEAYRYASRLAHDAGRKVALTLSDSFCVERHRQLWLDLITHGVDLLFANEAEICALYEVPSFDEAIDRVRGHCDVAALTCGSRGSVVVTADDTIQVDAYPCEQKVDTTGAGDLYAAGFLHGFTRQADLATCGLLGSLAATEVIGHTGARPATSLAELARPVVRV
jgi:sugar/nucleoside kinase (ribokinase family)